MFTVRSPNTPVALSSSWASCIVSNFTIFNTSLTVIGDQKEKKRKKKKINSRHGTKMSDTFREA